MERDHRRLRQPEERLGVAQRLLQQCRALRAGTHSKFGAYALLNHGGDFKAAAQTLAREGYGSKAEGKKKGKGKPAPSFPCSPCSGSYEIDQGRICRRRHDRDGSSYLEPLCNFTAQITSSVRVEDGAEVSHFFSVAGQQATGIPFPPVTVPAHDFLTMNWVLKAIGRN